MSDNAAERINDPERLTPVQKLERTMLGVAERNPLFRDSGANLVRSSSEVTLEGELPCSLKHELTVTRSFEGSEEEDDIVEDDHDAEALYNFDLSEIIRQPIAKLPGYALEALERKRREAEWNRLFGSMHNGFFTFDGVTRTGLLVEPAELEGELEFERMIMFTLDRAELLLVRTEVHIFYKDDEPLVSVPISEEELYWREDVLRTKTRRRVPPKLRALDQELSGQADAALKAFEARQDANTAKVKQHLDEMDKMLQASGLL